MQVPATVEEQQLGPALWGSSHSRQPDPEVGTLSDSLCLYGVTGNVGRRNGHSYVVFGLEIALKLLPCLVQQPPSLLGSEHLPLPWCGHEGQGGLLCRRGREGKRAACPFPGTAQDYHSSSPCLSSTC